MGNPIIVNVSQPVSVEVSQVLQTPEKWVHYSCVRGKSYTELRSKKPEREQEHQRIIQELGAKVFALVKKDDQATENMQLNLTHLTLTYQRRDGTTKKIDFRNRVDPQFNDPQLQELVTKVRTFVKDTWRRTSWASQFGSHASYSDAAPHAVGIPNEEVYKALPKNSADFFAKPRVLFWQKNPFEEMCASLKLDEPGKKTALERITVCETYTRTLQKELSTQIEDLEKELQQKTKKEAEELQEQIRLLKKLASRLEDRNVDHLYPAAAVIPSYDVNLSDPKQRQDLLEKATELTFKKEEVMKAKFPRLGPEGRLYALEEGDILIHNRMDKIARTQNNGVQLGGECIEEFLIHKLMTLGQDNSVKDLTSLDQSFTPATQARISSSLEKARQAAIKAKDDAIFGLKTQEPEALLKQLKGHADFGAFFKS